MSVSDTTHITPLNMGRTENTHPNFTANMSPRHITNPWQPTVITSMEATTKPNPHTANSSPDTTDINQATTNQNKDTLNPNQATMSQNQSTTNQSRAMPNQSQEPPAPWVTTDNAKGTQKQM